MDLWSIAKFLRGKCCFERRRHGSCGCHSERTGTNPCQITTDLADACERGERLDEVKQRVGIHICRNAGCNHKGCAQTKNVLDVLSNMV